MSVQDFSAPTAAPSLATIDKSAPGIPLSRLVQVEVRKMFNTKSGFWLMASIGILALVATIGVIAFMNGEDLEYSVFGSAIAVPMGILLPVIAILSVTGEWSQRTGLITFTLVPNRGKVILSKGVAAVLVGVVSMVLVLVLGALGNILGSAIKGVPAVWDVSVNQFLLIILANVLGMLVGFMLGALIRNSAGAIVGYFVYFFVVPTVFGVLAATQGWFESLQPWVDFNYSMSTLYNSPVAHDWATLAVSGLIWLVAPMTFGLIQITKAEVK
ncbi:ABC transporter permease subunit [Tomitella biformata]|uniref:ABC transporter permease subunit n=1 Tax=Tomitella biformata TaxID=630403 RepID=UPI000463809E|nr:ABC transporter permease subunit [Tomitella biformata]